MSATSNESNLMLLKESMKISTAVMRDAVTKINSRKKRTYDAKHLVEDPRLVGRDSMVRSWLESLSKDRSGGENVSQLSKLVLGDACKDVHEIREAGLIELESRRLEVEHSSRPLHSETFTSIDLSTPPNSSASLVRARKRLESKSICISHAKLESR